MLCNEKLLNLHTSLIRICGSVPTIFHISPRQAQRQFYLYLLPVILLDQECRAERDMVMGKQELHNLGYDAIWMAGHRRENNTRRFKYDRD
jgi:hypothetical protein